jgi:hypothetical protein
MQSIHLNNNNRTRGHVSTVSFSFSSSGLLKVGTPKTWDQSQKDLKYIRQAGVNQFISTYNRVKDLRGDVLLWGDEIEYGVFVLDPEQKKIRLALRAKEVSGTCMAADVWLCIHAPTAHAMVGTASP